MRIHACPFYHLWPDISFHNQGQLCPLTWAGWRDLSNKTRMSMVWSRRPEKKAKTWCNILTRKFSWKSSSSTLLPSRLFNPKILKALPKTFPYKMKPSKCPATGKKWGEKSKRREEERKQKEKVKTAVSLLIPAKTILKFCFLCILALHKQIFCIWISRLQNVRPVNRFVVHIIS